MFGGCISQPTSSIQHPPFFSIFHPAPLQRCLPFVATQLQTHCTHNTARRTKPGHPRPQDWCKQGAGFVGAATLSHTHTKIMCHGCKLLVQNCARRRRTSLILLRCRSYVRTADATCERVSAPWPARPGGGPPLTEQEAPEARSTFLPGATLRVIGRHQRHVASKRLVAS